MWYNILKGGNAMEKKVIRTPMKAIRAKCLDCCCNDSAEVAQCPIEDCPLWDYRFGRGPKGVIKVSRMKI